RVAIFAGEDADFERARRYGCGELAPSLDRDSPGRGRREVEADQVGAERDGRGHVLAASQTADLDDRHPRKVRSSFSGSSERSKASPTRTARYPDRDTRSMSLRARPPLSARRPAPSGIAPASVSRTAKSVWNVARSRALTPRTSGDTAPARAMSAAS